MKFSEQPVAWLTAIATILMVVVDVLNGTIDIGTGVNAIVVALSGIVAWHKVTPVSKLIDNVPVEFDEDE